MSDLSNAPPIPEESVIIEESASPWTMVVTMLLLISGFLLASTMMLHYSSPKIGEQGEITEVPFNISALIAKGKSYAANLKKPEKAAAVEPEKIAKSEKSTVSKLFGNRSDTVRWPKLKLAGFGSATEGDGGFAIINGKQIQPGQLIDGKVQLKLIRSHDVVVEYMGETKTLIVDVQD
ncbi:MAG: general secretion pathway protein GspB [Pontiella sp.]